MISVCILIWSRDEEKINSFFVNFIIYVVQIFRFICFFFQKCDILTCKLKIVTHHEQLI
jgi:hypothetical protein